MLKKISKKGYEFSFSWLFALIVGAVFIFLAIYVSTNIIQTKQFETETLSGKKIGVLLTPVETNLEQDRFATIFVSEETKVLNNCVLPYENTNPFGSQEIRVSMKQTFSDEWNEMTGVESTFHNKYLFSSNSVFGSKEIYVFAKPLVLPFKIADLVMLWGDAENFCFVNAPRDISSELSELSMTNIHIVSTTASCPAESVKVCFTGSSCDIQVNIDNANNRGTVKKDGQTLSYVESLGNDRFGLMFAAIFSAPEQYTCQIKRLMAHASYLAQAHSQKAKFLAPASRCPYASLSMALDNYASTAKSIAFSGAQLTEIYSKAKEVNLENPRACKIF